MSTKANKSMTGKIIARLRTQRNLTQKQLGALTGLSSTVISNYETGYISPRLDKLQLIADALKVDVSCFLTNNPELEDFIGQRIHTNTITFYKGSNVNGMLKLNEFDRDSYLPLPSTNKYDTTGLFCTEVWDNHLISLGISKGSLIIVNTKRKPKNGDTAAIIDMSAKKLIARIFVQEGPVIHLTANSYENINPIITSYDDGNYKIMGTVVAHISKLNYFE